MVDRGAKIQAINFSQDHGRLSIVQKIHAFVCGVCVCAVCVMCVLWSWCVHFVCVCVCRVVCCVWLCVWNVRFVFWWCVVCCCVLCGVWCVVCVCGAAWHPVCRLKSSQERLRVQHARVLPAHTEAFWTDTRRLFEPTRGGGGRRGFLISLSSLSLSLVPFSFSALSSPALFSSLSVTMTMIIRPVGFLCTQSSDLPECQCAWASVHSLLAEHIRSMQKKNCLGVSCASLVPLEMSGLAFALKMGVVFGCV